MKVIIHLNESEYSHLVERKSYFGVNKVEEIFKQWLRSDMIKVDTEIGYVLMGEIGR